MQTKLLFSSACQRSYNASAPQSARKQELTTTVGITSRPVAVIVVVVTTADSAEGETKGMYTNGCLDRPLAPEKRERNGGIKVNK